MKAFPFSYKHFNAIYRIMKQHQQTPERKLNAYHLIKLETLEPRLLMSGTPLLADHISALRDGIAAVKTFGESFDNTPLLNSELPLMDQTLGELFNVSEMLSGSLVDPLLQYFSAQPQPTMEGVAQSLNSAFAALNLADTSISSEILNEVLTFDIEYTANATRDTTLKLDSIKPGSGISINSSIDITVDFEYKFSASISVDPNASSAAEMFSLTFDNSPDANFAEVSMNSTVPESISAAIGLLGVSLDNPTINLSAKALLDTSSSGPLTISKLQSSDLTDLAQLQAEGVLNASFPISATLDGLPVPQVSAELLIMDDDLFDGVFDLADEQYLQLNNATMYNDFRAMTASSLFSSFQQLQGLFSNITDSSAFNSPIPFTGGKSIKDVLDVGQAFASKIIDQVSDGAEEAAPVFNTIQELIGTISDRITYVSEDDEVPAHVLMDLSFNHFFDLFSFGLDLGDGLGDLNSFGINASTEIGVEAELATAFQVGVLLQHPGKDFTFDDSTLISSLRRGMGIMPEAGDDIRITLRNGTSFNVDFSNAQTVGDLRTAIQSAANTATGSSGNLTVGFQTDTDIVTRNPFNVGLTITDHTQGGANSVLRIENLGTSLAGTALGITARAEDGVINSSPLHGRNLADNVFIQSVEDNPMLSATLRLIADDIDAQASLGFVGIDVTDGSAVGALQATLSLADYGTKNGTGSMDYDQRISLNEAFDSFSNLGFSLKAESEVLLPTTVAEEYGGILHVVIQNGDNTTTDLYVPYYVPASSPETPLDIGLLADAMEQAKDIIADEAGVDGSVLKISNAGQRISFSLTDGIARSVTVRPSGVVEMRNATGASDNDIARALNPYEDAFGLSSLVRADLTDSGPFEQLIGVDDDGESVLTGYVLRPNLTGSAEFDLPVGVTLGGAGGLDIDDLPIPDLPNLNISIPDITLPNFSAPGAVNVDLGGLGDLLALKDISFDNVFTALQGGLDYLRNVEALQNLSIMNQNIPLINITLNEVLNVSAVLSDVLVQFQENPATSLGLVDEILEDLFSISENSSELISINPSQNVNLENTFITIYDEAADIDRVIDVTDSEAYDDTFFDGEYETLTDLLKSDLFITHRLPEFSVSIFPEFNTSGPFTFPVYDAAGDQFRNVHLFDRGQFDPSWFDGQFESLEDFLKSELIQGDDDLINISYDTTSFEENGEALPALRIDLGFEIASFGLDVPVNLDLAELNVPGLTDLVDARAEGMVKLDAAGLVTIPLGLDLSGGGIPQPFLYGFDRQTGEGEGVSIDLLFKATGSGLSFDAAVGALGVSIMDGTLNIGGSASFNDLNNAGKFSIGLRDVDETDDGRIFFADMPQVYTALKADPLSLLAINAEGSANVAMSMDFAGLDLSPLSGIIPGITFPLELELGIPDFNALSDGLSFADGDFTVTVGGKDAQQVFNEIMDIFSGDFNVLSMVGGWDGAFDLLIEAMRGEVFGIDLPFIGDQLAQQANFLEDIKNSVSSNLSDNAENEENRTSGGIVDDVVQDIFDALGPGGINLLRDITGDNAITADDIAITNMFSPSSDDFDPTNPGFAFELKFGSDLVQLDLPFDFDLGVPGLQFDIDASLVGKLGFDFGLKMGVDLQHGFFIDTNVTGLDVFLDVAVPGLSASGELGFLRVDAEELLVPALALVGEDQALASQFNLQTTAMGSPANFMVKFHQDQDIDAGEATVTFDTARRNLTFTINSAKTTAAELVELVNTTPELSTHFSAELIGDGSGFVDANQRAAGVANSFAGVFSVDLLDPDKESPDGLLSLAEIFRVKSFSDVISISATAAADFNAHLTVELGDAAKFPSIRTDLSVDWDFEVGESVPLPVVGFSDLELNLGEFFGGFASGVFDEVEKILDPVRPIVDLLRSEVPVISELSGSKVTFLDLARLNGGAFKGAAAFIDAVGLLLDIIDAVPDIDGDLWLNMGGGSYDPNTGQFTPSGTLADIISSADSNPDLKLDSSTYLMSKKDLNRMSKDKLKLGFPVLDPSNIFKMFSGEVVDLFTLELPKFKFEAMLSTFFALPPVPVVGIEIAGRLGAEIDLAFGFDSFGVQQYLDSGNVADIFNGFFVFDHETADGGGEDIPELTLSGSVTAAAALRLALLSASVGGGIFATVNFNLHDNDDDGKIRLVELLDNVLLGTQDGLGPLHIFDVTGKVEAGLFAKVEVNLLLTTITKTFDLARITLVDFEIPRPEGEGVPLAQKNGSTLELNIGPNAHRRRFFFTDDVAETYKIIPGPSDSSVRIEAFGRSQVYEGISVITGNAGLGDDKITVSEDVNIPVILSGGAGNDLIIGGSGADRIEGNEGNDEIRGGGGNDIIIGGIGRNKLFGDGGNDKLTGGDQDDKIEGGAGNDIIIGGGGVDNILGGLGNDNIQGGLGNDIINGDEGDDFIDAGDGNDQVDGGSGSDTIYGRIGNDQIIGGDGADEIHAGEGNDTVYGGVGNDVIFGGLGNDRLFGGNSRDEIYGEQGDDLIEGGAASDDLYGGQGNDTIYANTQNHNEIDDALHTLVGGIGNDLIYGQFGADTVYGDNIPELNGQLFTPEDGHDRIYTFAGTDIIYAGGGNDIVHAGDDDDFIVGGIGDDELHGNQGDDAIMGGVQIGLPEDYDLGNFSKFESFILDSKFTTPPRINPEETAHRIVPLIVLGIDVSGNGDGVDTINGNGGNDWIFGGDEADFLSGGEGRDYIDAGAGNDISVSGGAGDDVIRGNVGDDILHGDEGIDQLYGEAGEDSLFGDSTEGSTANVNQRLFGGAASDKLFAWAPDGGVVGAPGVINGDELYGGANNDSLYGNLNNDLMYGEGGDDFIHGDYLNGSTYVRNTMADLTGGHDTIFGGSGEDKIFGGGGDDTIWGGGNTDTIDGQDGSDTQFGGLGIDLFIAPTFPLYTGNDVIDGHRGNERAGDFPDDGATDILVIRGTNDNDQIVLSQTDDANQYLNIRITNEAGFLYSETQVDWLDENDNPLIEQFQVSALGGNDIVGFGMDDPIPGMHPAFDLSTRPTVELDFSSLVARSNDFIGVFDGSGGNDILLGSSGRDRLDGGLGSDILYGLAGDDRLWGDSGDGSGGDVDVLFAGQGNDDLLGGQGQNLMYAWTIAPNDSLIPDIGSPQGNLLAAQQFAALTDLVNNFGVFVDQSEQIVTLGSGVTNLTNFKLENTGLNRVIGNERDDYLFGGTALDFLFGNGGNDTLFRKDGSTFESLDEGVAGEEWKEYAKSTDAVWYIAATNANDQINVDFVTEPGLLTDHHLVTRLTENNGNFSFAAQVRLDFDATDADGNHIWDANDIVLDANARLAALNNIENAGTEIDDDLRASLFSDLEIATTNLTNGLLPPEGDFLAIIIDALDGNDEITVGPTVQKTVWVDAGAGDDIVTINGGNAILVDKTENRQTLNGLRGRNDLPTQPFNLSIPNSGIQYDNLTIDNPDDDDWYQFSLTQTFNTMLNLVSDSPDDDFTINIYSTSRADDNAVSPLLTTTGTQTASLDLSALMSDTPYLLEVFTDRTPTIYGIEFNVSGQTPVLQDMALRRDNIRRDVILGGAGNDILTGGAGEDFIFGQEGNDVLNGGVDNLASDILFAGEGNDTFQIIPDTLPRQGNSPDSVFSPDEDQFIPTYSDQFIGGGDQDRVLFQGGDFDRRGLEIPDYAAIRYNTGLHRYEFASLVWDIGKQKFMTEADLVHVNDPNAAVTAAQENTYAKRYLFYQTRGVEQTQVVLRAGDDVFHADAGFKFPTVNGIESEEWGIKEGQFQQGATEAELIIQGDEGNDQLFGGFLIDRINGGAGNDVIIGGPGNDQILGEGGDDSISGNADPSIISQELTIAQIEAPRQVKLQQLMNDFGLEFDSEAHVYDTALPFFVLPEDKRNGVNLTDENPEPIAEAFAIDGSFDASGQVDQLSSIVPIGDFNGDDKPDYLISGEHRSYIVFKAFELDDHPNIETIADVIINHSAFGMPGQRFGDMITISGESQPSDDLVFIREVGTNVIVRVFGYDTSYTQRLWDQSFFNSMSSADYIEFTLPKSLIGSAANTEARIVQIVNDATGREDLVISAKDRANVLLNVDHSINAGYIFSANVRNSTPTLGGSQYSVLDRKGTIILEDTFGNSRPGGEVDNINLEVIDNYDGEGNAAIMVNDYEVYTSDFVSRPDAVAPQQLNLLPNLDASLQLQLRDSDINSGVTRSIAQTVSLDTDFSPTTNELIDSIRQQLVNNGLDGRWGVAYNGSTDRITFYPFESNSSMRHTLTETIHNKPLGYLATVSASSFFGFSDLIAIPQAPLQIMPGLTTRISVTVEYSSFFPPVHLTIPGTLEVTFQQGDTASSIASRLESSAFTLPNNNEFRSVFSDNSAEVVTAGGNIVAVKFFSELEPALQVSNERVTNNAIFGDLDNGGFFSSGQDSGSPFIQSRNEPSSRRYVEYRLKPRGTINGDSTPVRSPHAIGDINFDGYADVAIVSDSGVYAFLGNQFNDDVNKFDLNRAEFHVSDTNGRVIDVTGGNYDLLHGNDIAITYTTTTGISEVAVIFNPFFFVGSPVSLADANVILPAEAPNDNFGIMPELPGLDLDNDFQDDLVIGASGSVSEKQGNFVDDGGRVYVIYGRYQLPGAADNIIELSNTSYPGSGSYVEDTGTGRVEIFQDGDRPYTMDDTREQWFRFSTLGDGQGGNVIRLKSDKFRADLIDDEGRVLYVDRSIFDLRDVDAGTYFLRVYSYVQVVDPSTTDDLVAYWSFDNTLEDQADEIGSTASNVDDDLQPVGGAGQFDSGIVNLAGRMGVESSDPGQYRVSLSDDLKLSSTMSIEGWIFPTEINTNWQRLFLMWNGTDEIYHMAILGNELEFSVTQSNGVRRQIFAGRINEGQWQHVAGVADGTHLRMYLNGEEIASLAYDGTIDTSVAEGFGIGGAFSPVFTDLRFNGLMDEVALWNRPLTSEEISNHFNANSYGYFHSRDYQIEMLAPQAGHAHESITNPDDDVIHAGDGNDLIIGNHGTDEILGGSGFDSFTAEFTEVKDFFFFNDGFPQAVPNGQRIIDSAPIYHDFPITEFNSLSRLVANETGIPFNRGAIEFERYLKLTNFTSLRDLDARVSNLSSLDDFEILLNLETLDLSFNPQLDITDLQNLVPRLAESSHISEYNFTPGEFVGLSQLHDLDLSGNSNIFSHELIPIIDKFTNLERLKMYVHSVDDDVQLGLLLGETFETTLFNLGASNWSIIDPDGQTVATATANNNISFTPTTAGIHIVRIDGIDDFPLIVNNQRPEFTKDAAEITLNEGDVITEQELLALLFNNGNSTDVSDYATDTPGDTLTTNVLLVDQQTGVEAQISTGSVRFDGINDYIGTNKSLLNDLTQFSISGWIKPDDISGTRVGLFGQNDAIEFGFIDADAKQIQLWTPGGGNITVTYPHDYNEWHHIAAVADGTNIRMFIDGQLVGIGGVPTANYGSSNDNFNIGGGGVFDTPALNGNFFTGNIDELSLWDRAITPDEIQKLSQGIVDTRSNNLIAYWPMNEKAGDIIRDRTNGNLPNLEPLNIESGGHDGQLFGGDYEFVTDDFEDNVINGKLWGVNVDLPSFPGAEVTETGGHMEFTGRGFLNTAKQHNPVTDGSVTITGRWEFVSGDDFLQVITRSDGIPNDAFFGEATNGIEFVLRDDQPNGFTIMGRGGAVVTNVAGAQTFTVNPGDVFDFIITDDGNNLSFTINEVGGTGRTATVTANSTTNMPVNHISFHNRESNRRSNLDDVSITTNANRWDAEAPDELSGNGYTIPDDGLYGIRTTVYDSQGAFKHQDVILNVNNLLPVVPDLPDFSTDVGQLLTFNALGASDAGPLDNDNLSYRWYVTTNTGQEIESVSSFDFSFTPDFAGTYNVSLEVIDPQGAVNADTATVTVSPIARVNRIAPNLTRFIQISNFEGFGDSLSLSEVEAYSLIDGHVVEVANLDNGATIYSHTQLDPSLEGVTDENSIIDNVIFQSHEAWTTTVIDGSVTIDLGQEYDIAQINLWPSMNCCSSNLERFEVTLFADNGFDQPGDVTSHQRFFNNQLFDQPFFVVPNVGQEGQTITFDTQNASDSASTANRTYTWKIGNQFEFDTTGQLQITQPLYEDIDSPNPQLSFLPTNEGNYVGQVVITDTIGGQQYVSATETFFFSTQNANQTIALDGPSLINEGDYELDVSISDAGPYDNYTLFVDWGDGAFDSVDIATPLHRYDFSGFGTFIQDFAGNADANIQGGAFLDGSGQLTLDGIDDFVELPISETIATLQNATFEAWVTITEDTPFQHVFDFGNSTSEHMFITPRSGIGQNPASVEWRDLGTVTTSDGRQRINGPILPVGQKAHLATVIDQDNDLIHLYVNGQLSGSNSMDGFTLAQLGETVNNWLGRSHYNNDPFLSGSYDEFRIYGSALNEGQLLASYTAGPDLLLNENPTATLTHTYPEAGDYNIFAFVVDQKVGDEFAQQSINITVNNAAPLLEINSDQPAYTDGQSVTLTGSIDDIGADTHDYYWLITTPTQVEIGGVYYPQNAIVNNFNNDPTSAQPALGQPDQIALSLAGNEIVYDLGDHLLYDTEGVDFNIYERSSGVSEFNFIEVEVSADRNTWFDITSTESSIQRIAGDSANLGTSYARSYDVSPASLDHVRYIRVSDIRNPSANVDGFDLDAIGLQPINDLSFTFHPSVSGNYHAEFIVNDRDFFREQPTQQIFNADFQPVRVLNNLQSETFGNPGTTTFLTAGGQAQGTVLIVSDAVAPGQVGGNHEDDALVEFLQRLGYTVDTTGMGGAFNENSSPFSDPTELQALNRADLVIVSRRTISGSYDNDRQLWNELDTPMLLMSGFLTRGGNQSLFGWTTGSSGNVPLNQTDITIQTGFEDSAYFNHLNSNMLFDWSDASGQQAPKAIFLPNSPVIEGANVLATMNNQPFLFEIPEGTDFDNGNTAGPYGIAGEDRVFLGHWGYDEVSQEYDFDDFATDDYLQLTANVIGELVSAARRVPVQLTKSEAFQHNAVFFNQSTFGKFDTLEIEMEFQITSETDAQGGLGLMWLNSDIFGQTNTDVNPHFNQDISVVGSFGIGFDTNYNSGIDISQGLLPSTNTVSVHYNGTTHREVPFGSQSAVAGTANLPVDWLEDGRWKRAKVSLDTASVIGATMVNVHIEDILTGQNIHVIQDLLIYGMDGYEGRLAIVGSNSNSETDHRVDHVSVTHTSNGVVQSFEQDFEIGTALEVIQPPAPVATGTPFTMMQFGEDAGPQILHPDTGFIFGDGVANADLTLIGEQQGSFNMVAFNQTAVTPPASGSFDFAITDTGAFGRGEGLSFMLLPSVLYGESGVVDADFFMPGNQPIINEAAEPNIPLGFSIGIDTFDDGSEGTAEPGIGNHISMHYDGVEYGRTHLQRTGDNNASIDLANGADNNLYFNITQVTGGSNVTVIVVDGTDQSQHLPFHNFFIPNMELLTSRVAFAAQNTTNADRVDIDNIDIHYQPTGSNYSTQTSQAILFNVQNASPSLLNFFHTQPGATYKANQRVSFAGLGLDDMDDTVRAMVDFGDGVRLPASVQAINQVNQNQQYVVNTSHIYKSSGHYEVTLELYDLDGDMTRMSTNITVSPQVTVDALTTNDSTPPLSGTIDSPDADIQLVINGNTYSASNRGNGTWELPDNDISPALSDGEYDIDVIVEIDSTSFDAVSFDDILTVDTQAPLITVDSQSTSDTTPAITGTVDDPAASINLTLNGRDYAAINLGNGAWILPDNAINPALPFDLYSIHATATDLAGNVGTDNTDDELEITDDSSIPGDFDLDRDVDADDIDLLASAIRNNNQASLYDIDDTPGVSQSDFNHLIRNILGTEYGDTNLDKVVNLTDLSVLATFFGQSNLGWASGNFNTDTEVNLADLAILAEYFGTNLQQGGGSAQDAAPQARQAQTQSDDGSAHNDPTEALILNTSATLTPTSDDQDNSWSHIDSLLNEDDDVSLI